MITALRLAWRLAAGRSGLAWLAVACITVGVAARGAVAGTVAAFEVHLAGEARQLIAADVEVSSGRPLDTDVRAAFSAALPPGARIAESRSLLAMASTNGSACLVELRAIGPGWPLAGALIGEPAGSERALSGAAPAVLVDPDLLPRLGVAVGGHLRLGSAELVIAGTIVSEPAAGSDTFRFGPRVYAPIEALASAGLGGATVRARYRLHAVLPDPLTGNDVATDLRRRLDLPSDLAEDAGGPSRQAPVTVRSAHEAAERSTRAAGVAGSLLRLVALFALALGALGVAALAHGMMRAQAEDLALLRVLGATRVRAAGIFALQAAGLGATGGLVGTAIGAGLAALAAQVLGCAPVLPHLSDLGIGVGLGVLAALAAAALPALALAGMEPLAVLRGEAPARPPWFATVVVLATALTAAGFAAACEAPSTKVGWSVVVGTGAIALLLAGAAWLILPLIAAIRPRGYALRHGLGNLARSGRRLGTLPVALGLAAALGTALLTLRSSFAAEVAPARLAAAPSFFALDVQDDQRQPFAAALAARSLAPNLRPLVRGRLTAIDGVSTTAPRPGVARESEQAAFFRRREQNLSWADRPGPGETLTAGRWPTSGSEVVLEQRWADRLGAHIGSRLSFDVTGMKIETTVVGLRRVEWLSMQPNFFIVLGPGALEDSAPIWLGTIPSLPRSERRVLAADLAKAFPNVSLIDIADAAEAIRQIMDRIALGVAAVIGVALLAGLAVVAGTAAASARERRAEAALVRVLGGTRGTVMAVIASEFAIATLVAAVLGAGLGLLGAWALAKWQLEIATVPPWTGMALLIATMSAAAMLTALAAARRAWRVEPMAVLREE